MWSGVELTPPLRYLGTNWVTDSYMSLQRHQWEFAELGIQSQCTRMPSRLAMVPWNRIIHRTPEVAILLFLQQSISKLLPSCFEQEGSPQPMTRTLKFTPSSLLVCLTKHFLISIFYWINIYFLWDAAACTLALVAYSPLWAFGTTPKVIKGLNHTVHHYACCILKQLHPPFWNM